MIAAVGRAEMVKGDWLKEGAVVIDVGINQITDTTAKRGLYLTDLHINLSLSNTRTHTLSHTRIHTHTQTHTHIHTYTHTHTCSLSLCFFIRLQASW